MFFLNQLHLRVNKKTCRTKAIYQQYDIYHMADINMLGTIRKHTIMKLISKEASIRLLGRKKGFFGQNMNLGATPIFYLGGLQQIDNELDSIGLQLKDQMSMFNKYPNGCELEFFFLPGKSGSFSSKTFRLPILPNQIKKWTTEKQDAVYEQQSKSVVGRAIVGGLLFGGAGAVVGAISGTNGEKKKANFIDYLLTVVIDVDGKEKAIVLGFPNNAVKEVRQFFDENFPNTFIESEQFEIENKSVTQSNSIADELMKFKELLDTNVITQAEFDSQKEKLLFE